MMQALKRSVSFLKKSNIFFFKRAIWLFGGELERVVGVRSVVGEEGGLVQVRLVFFAHGEKFNF